MAKHIFVGKSVVLHLLEGPELRTHHCPRFPDIVIRFSQMYCSRTPPLGVKFNPVVILDQIENGRGHPVAVELTVDDHSHSDGHSHVHLKSSSLRDFLTVLALSCHAIFEGLAIGLEKDTEAVWTLFAGN